jgi:hypothetical protein
VIEPRKESAEADAVRKAEGNIDERERVDSSRGHRAGHACEGILETWEISSTPSRGGTAERRKRSEAEVGEKSERADSSGEGGEPDRRDPVERSGVPEHGTVWRKDDRDIGLGSSLNEN